MYPILIVDDEPAIAELIELTLQDAGYTCVTALNGDDAADYIERQRFDLILLDVMLPGVDGFSLMEYIEPTGTPVMFITARDAVEDRVRGLRAGAYDYIIKPFAASELLARVDGLMRHTGRRGAVLQLWDVTIDPEIRAVRKNGTPVEMTPHEYDLLLTLARSRGTALYRDVLFERVWGIDSDAGPRTLDVHVSRLRKKLGWETKLRAIPKIGYLLEREEDA
ncbi:MAG: response regulator transcription factor [Subdoligranulum sp.]|nr:response regulator transcription factor [Subdoligranulum sp.]